MRKPLQVSIVTQYFYPDFGAEGQLLTDLAVGLVSRGCEVVVHTTHTSYASRERARPTETYKGVAIRRVFSTRFDRKRRVGRMINSLSFLASMLVTILADRRSAPLLIVSNPPFLGLVGYLASRLRGRAYVHLVLDVYPDIAVQLGYLKPDGLLRKLWDWLNRLIIARATRVVALSEPMAQILMKKDTRRPSTDAEKFVVIHNWADEELIRPRRKAENWFVARHSLDGVFVVLYSGNMGLSHDLETVLGAAARLRNEDIVFLLIGEGAKKQKLETMALQDQLHNVRFLPYQPPDVFPYSATCSDLSLVTQESGIEGLAMPSKVYTILASGRPAVALVKREAEISRMIEEGRCGMIVAPKDVDGLVNAIDYYYRNREAAAQDGQNGRAYFEKRYTLTRACGEYYTLLEALV